MNWRYSEGGQNFLKLAQEYRCGQCKKRFEQPWVVPTGNPWPNNLTPNVNIAYHWEDTHGFPHDLFWELVMTLIYRPEDAKKLMKTVGRG